MLRDPFVIADLHITTSELGLPTSAAFGTVALLDVSVVNVPLPGGPLERGDSPMPTR